MGVSFPGVAVGAPVLVSQAADASPFLPLVLTRAWALNLWIVMMYQLCTTRLAMWQDQPASISGSVYGG